MVMTTLSRTSLCVLAVAALGAVLGACGGGGSDGPPDGPPVDNSSILGGNAASYAETNEAGNGSEASEATGYTLDNDGLRISGSFEASGTTDDFYRFNTGTFTHIDVQVFVDGVKQNEQNYRARLTLNSYVNDGYSTLDGNGYFINAWMSGTNKDYVLGIHNVSAAGAAYVIEMKGH